MCLNVKKSTNILSTIVDFDFDFVDFDFRVNTHLNKASKNHAPTRICNYINTKTRCVLMNVFIIFQFSYSPLVWMSYSRTMNTRITKFTKKLQDLSIKQIQISLLVTYWKRTNTTQKIKFSINGKLHFLCNENGEYSSKKFGKSSTKI